MGTTGKPGTGDDVSSIRNTRGRGAQRIRTRSRATVGAARFTFIDLFAGIGGFRRAFEAFGGRCVFTSEKDRHALVTYKANYDCEHAVAGDITAVAAEEIPPHDLLLAGFPCQPFSIAGVTKRNALGRRHGFACNTQGTLFFDVARIIQYHRPLAFLLENVKNLLGHDQGKTFGIIRSALADELGYAVSWRVIDARWWVPQRRERLFIVGFRDSIPFDFEDMTPGTAYPVLSSVLHTEDGQEDPEEPYTTGRTAEVSPRYTLSDKLWAYLQQYADRHRRAGHGFGYGLCGPNDVARTMTARYGKDGSEILVRQSHRNPRRLTPRECARLMGFRGTIASRFRIPVSDTQAYRQFGNSVVVPVIEAIARRMLACLGIV